MRNRESQPRGSSNQPLTCDDTEPTPGLDTKADIDGSYTLPSSWNDRISSFQGFGNCETPLYQNGHFTGSTYGPAFATDNVGATMNDQTSAVRVY